MVAVAATYGSHHHADPETVAGLIATASTLRSSRQRRPVRDHFRQLVRAASPPVREVIVNAEAIYDLDTTGIQMLQRLLDDLDGDGVVLAFARVRTSVLELLRDTGLEQRIGPANFHLRVETAVGAFQARPAESPTRRPS